MKKLIIAAFFLTSTVLTAQRVLGVGNFIHVVANLDKSIEFYHDGLGLEMTGAPGPRAFSANAVVSSLYDAPGAQSRVASFKIPESDMALEIVEFQGLNATPVGARFFDPGAITLTLPVQDVEAMKTRLYADKGAGVDQCEHVRGGGARSGRDFRRPGAAPPRPPWGSSQASS